MGLPAESVQNRTQVQCLFHQEILINFLMMEAQKVSEIGVTGSCHFQLLQTHQVL